MAVFACSHSIGGVAQSRAGIQEFKASVGVKAQILC